MATKGRGFDIADAGDEEQASSGRPTGAQSGEGATGNVLIKNEDVIPKCGGSFVSGLRYDRSYWLDQDSRFGAADRIVSASTACPGFSSLYGAAPLEDGRRSRRSAPVLVAWSDFRRVGCGLRAEKGVV